MAGAVRSRARTGNEGYQISKMLSRTNRYFQFQKRGQLSSARTTKRFPSPRCASAIQNCSRAVIYSWDVIYSASIKRDKGESRTRAGGLRQRDSFTPGNAARAVLRDGQRRGCQEQPPLQSRWGISRLVSRLQRAIGDFEHLVRPAGMEAGREDASLAGEHDPIGRIPRDRAFHGVVLGNRTACGGDCVPARWHATPALISGSARVVKRNRRE
jgi:hypothetical protein